MIKINTLTKILFIIFFLPFIVSAEEYDNSSKQKIFSGKVLEILSEEMRAGPNTNTKHIHQVIKVEVLSESKQGDILTVKNDYLKLQVGDKIYFKQNIFGENEKSFWVFDVDRKSSLLFLGIFFIMTVLIFNGWQGFRSLIALSASLLAIFYILIPSLLSGWNPLFISLIIASGILFFSIFLTRGFNKKSAVAYLGAMITILITSVFAYFAVQNSNFSGFADEVSVYLNFKTEGSLNFIYLLISAIIIGTLGVLDDIAVTQVEVVNELYDSNKKISRKEVYLRAMRIGRAHTGSLINTLVLAYTGAALPILLLTYSAIDNFSLLINSEIFAVEIVRTIVGSVGLILTVPIVTILAVFYLKKSKK